MNDSYRFLGPVICAALAGVFIGYGILEESALLGYGHIGGGAAAVVFLLVISSRLLAGVTQHVSRFTRTLSFMSEGNYEDISVAGENREEVRKMYHAFNEMKGGLKDMVSNIKESVSNLFSLSDKFSSSSDNLLINTDSKLHNDIKKIPR